MSRAALTVSCVVVAPVRVTLVQAVSTSRSKGFAQQVLDLLSLLRVPRDVDDAPQRRWIASHGVHRLPVFEFII